jgi:broad specificity phosphatase PhoE
MRQPIWISVVFALFMPAIAFGGNLVLIRHGNSQHNLSHEYNSDPTHSRYNVSCLTPLGVKQASKTAQQLISAGYNDNNIAEVIVSPLPRTRQTANVFIERGLFSADKIRVDERLIEISAGNREGMSSDLFHEDLWERHDSSKYNGETNIAVRQRIVDLYEETSERFSNDDSRHVLYITHGVPSYELIDYIKGEKIRMQTAEAMILPLKKETG